MYVLFVFVKFCCSHLFSGLGLCATKNPPLYLRPPNLKDKLVRAQWDAQVRALRELPMGGGGKEGARHGHQHRRQHQRARHVPVLRLSVCCGLQ